MKESDVAVRLDFLAEALNSTSAEAGPRSVVGMSGGRDSRGRFAAEISFNELLDRVALVAGAAAACAGEGCSPLSVSKAAFDAARASEKELTLPSAEGVRKRLGIPWPRVLELAVGDRARRGLMLSVQSGQRRAQFTGEDADVLRALRAVAFAHGASPTPHVYDTISRGIQRRRRGRGLDTVGLPQSQVVIQRFRGWNAGLSAAGLEPLPPAGPPTPEKAVPAVELLDRCIRETGLLPSSRWLVRWCRAHGIPVSERALQPWQRTLAETRALRAKRGEHTPDKTAPASGYPTLPDRPEGLRQPHSREAVIASLRRYGDKHLRIGERPRYKHYQAMAGRDPDLIAASVIGRHGRFQDLCAEAGL